MLRRRKQLVFFDKFDFYCILILKMRPIFDSSVECLVGDMKKSQDTILMNGLKIRLYIVPSDCPAMFWFVTND